MESEDSINHEACAYSTAVQRGTRPNTTITQGRMVSYIWTWKSSLKFLLRLKLLTISGKMPSASAGPTFLKDA